MKLQEVVDELRKRVTSSKHHTDNWKYQHSRFLDELSTMQRFDGFTAQCSMMEENINLVIEHNGFEVHIECKGFKDYPLFQIAVFDRNGKLGTWETFTSDVEVAIFALSRIPLG